MLSAENFFRLHFWVIRVGSHGTFVIGSLAFKLFAAVDLYSVNCGQVALYRSAGRVVEFVNVGRNLVVATKSGPVETVPIVPVATALYKFVSLHDSDHEGVVRIFVALSCEP